VDHLDILEHAKIFDFLLSDCGAIICDENQLGFSSSDAPFGRSIAKNGFSRLEHQSEFGVDCL